MNKVKELRWDIIEMLTKIDDVELLTSIKNELQATYQKSPDHNDQLSEPPAFMEAVKPIREKAALEEIMKEQNYKPITFSEFRAIAEQMDWENVSLDDLLESIK